MKPLNLKPTPFQTVCAALAAWLCLAAIPATAQLSYITNSDNTTATITGYNTNAGLNVVIPASTNNYRMTAIGDQAFYHLTTITNVTIPNSVTNIGVDAFWNCSGLTSVTIPNSVTSIGDEAFGWCYALTSVTIGNGVTTIGAGAFDGCSGLTSVTIPNSITTIGNGAFYNCSGLTSVVIGNSVTTIGTSTFEYCSNLTSVTIPNSVTTIGQYVFQGCSGLTNMVIGSSVTSIGLYAFNGCSSLTSVTIPNSVTTIGEVAFEGCRGLTSVVIGNSVTTIGSWAFYGCSGLTNVSFQGNAPTVMDDSGNISVGSTDTSVFYGETGTVYYLPGTSGWGSTFGGWPTAWWHQPIPMILGTGSGLGATANGFCFIISWATNKSVIVQACTNLANPVWIPVATNSLASGTNYFNDPQWTNYPNRFYRVRSP